MKRLRRNSTQHGATLYEFAAILPIILFIMLGIVDFGRAMYAYHFVASAARAATRWASVRVDPRATLPAASVVRSPECASLALVICSESARIS